MRINDDQYQSMPINSWYFFFDVVKNWLLLKLNDILGVSKLMPNAYQYWSMLINDDQCRSIHDTFFYFDVD